MRKRIFILGLAFLVILILLAILLIACAPPTPLSTPERETSVAVTTAPFPTLPPPLAKVPFPTKEVDYPPDWPTELRFPEEFRLVDVSSGVFLKGDKGGAAKLLYKGHPQKAAELLSSFFVSRNWQIIKRYELDSGGVTLLIKRNKSGIIVIDPDPNNPEYTRIAVTLSLEQ